MTSSRTAWASRFSRALLGLYLAAIAPLAAAHAFLDQASPRVGSTTRSPPQVTLRFTEELEAAFSSVRVLDEEGRQVDRQDKQLDPADRTVMRVSLPPLEPGTYRVVWRVLSVDTHVTEGDFTFVVAP
jgi:methionine-rich copper-binding protein CopC